jgi:hypothetical protein
MGMRSVLGGVGLLLMGCGSTADLSCSSDKDCLESEICNLDVLMCAQLCILPNDADNAGRKCPESADTCEAASGSDPRKVCKCKREQCP